MLDPFTRRKFFVTAILLSGLVIEFGPSALYTAKAFAQSGAQMDPATRKAMLQMARLLYPHDAIPDAVYAEVLDKTLTAVASGPAFAAAMRQAEQVLNTQASGPWIDLDETRQIAAMRMIEKSDAFIAIQMAVQAGFYNHPAVWVHLGYEGPSFDKGGYLNRGAGVVDWLPGGQ